MIAIIDYDMGNVRSVSKAFERLGSETLITRDPAVIEDSSHVVLPGVGAFGDCMRNLEKYGLITPVLKAIESGKPFLGICLGLQLLFEESEEGGEGGGGAVHKGLGVMKGRVVRFAPHLADPSTPEHELKVPHMGWNEITRAKDSELLKGIPDGSYFYFVHSYYAIPAEPEVVLTHTGYGVEFASSVARDNLFACQFHTEKSQRMGLRVLKNFIKIK